MNAGGFALMTALAFLMIFSLAGGAFLMYMTLEMDRTDIVTGKTRARLAASGGIQAVAANLEAASAAQNAAAVVAQSPMKFQLPVYFREKDGALTEDERYVCVVEVKITPASDDPTAGSYHVTSEANIKKFGKRMGARAYASATINTTGQGVTATSWSEAWPETTDTPEAGASAAQ